MAGPIKEKMMKEVHDSEVKSLTELNKKQSSLVNTYRGLPKKEIEISPLYRPYFGNIMRVTINGIAVTVRVDGSKQIVPSNYYDEIKRRIRKVDEQNSRMDRMSKISENVERNPGELKF